MVIALVFSLVWFVIGVQAGIWLPRRVVLWMRGWYYRAGHRLWVRFGDGDEG